MTATIERVLGWTACAAALALLIAALIAAPVAAAADLTASSATVRLAAIPGRPAAGYLTLRGGPAMLVAVASPLARRIELHASTMAGGMMRMDALAAVPVRPGASTVFAPGGRHLMIFGLKPGLRPGAAVPLVLRFADGRTLNVAARAVAPGAAVGSH